MAIISFEFLEKERMSSAFVVVDQSNLKCLKKQIQDDRTQIDKRKGRKA